MRRLHLFVLELDILQGLAVSHAGVSMMILLLLIATRVDIELVVRIMATNGFRDLIQSFK